MSELGLAKYERAAFPLDLELQCLIVPYSHALRSTSDRSAHRNSQI